MNKNSLLVLTFSFFVFSLHTMREDCYSINKHPLMKAENLTLLYSLANRVSHEVDRSFPVKKQVLLGLGQSPAYLLEMIRFFDSRKGRIDRYYRHVAFSGNFYSGRSNELCQDPSLFKKYRAHWPHYQRYLDSVGLSEQDLNKEDTKFIILEICHSGKGLRSFLSLFDQYRKKPEMIYMQSADFEPIPLGIRCVIDGREKKLTTALASTDHFNDRLVPEFQWHKWESVDPLQFKPHENTHIVLKRLQAFVDFYDVD